MGFSFSFKLWFVSSAIILLGAAVANAAPDLLAGKKLTPLPNLEVQFACDANGALKPMSIVGVFPLFASRVPSNYVTRFTIADVAWKERPELMLEQQEIAYYLQGQRYLLAKMSNDEFKTFTAAPACQPGARVMKLVTNMGTEITYEYAVERDCGEWRRKFQRFPKLPLKERDCTIKSKISYKTEGGVTELFRTENITESDDLFTMPDFN